MEIERNIKLNVTNKNIHNIQRKVLLDKNEFLKTSWNPYILGDTKFLEYI